MFLPKKRSSRRAKHEAQAGSPLRRPGRPMKPPSEMIPSRAEKRQDQKRLRDWQLAQKTPTHHELSALEQLPLEIVQHIFFLCLETNLASTSLVLNRYLSNETIYRAVLLFAYFDGNSVLPVETPLFRPAEYRYVNYTDRCRLQRSILKCRWCTFDRIKAVMPTLSRLAMFQRWQEEHRLEKAVINGIEQQKNLLVPDPSLADIAPLPNIDDTEAMKQHFLATADATYYLSTGSGKAIGSRAITGNDGYLPFINYWSCTRDENGDIHKTLDGADTVLGVRHLPSSLLEGPWTEERVSFIMLLRQGMRYVSRGHILDISVEALFRGMEAAVSDLPTWRSLRTLTVLLELWSHVYGPREGHSREKIPPSHPLPLNLFHVAIQQNPDEVGFMELLIRADLHSIPGDDAIITGWAIRMRDQGNRLGSWLLDYMTHHDSEADTALLFNNGALSWRRREGFYPFPERSFTQDLEYICDRAVNAYPTAPDGGACG